jgi:hypothetical protein
MAGHPVILVNQAVLEIDLKAQRLDQRIVQIRTWVAAAKPQITMDAKDCATGFSWRGRSHYGEGRHAIWY